MNRFSSVYLNYHVKSRAPIATTSIRRNRSVPRQNRTENGVLRKYIDLSPRLRERKKKKNKRGKWKA